MNLSVGFILGSILFLTPALILIGALRIYYPIHRTISFLKQGLVLPATALIISVAINGPVLLDYVAWSRTNLPDLWGDVSSSTVTLLVGGTPSYPYRPGLWFLKHVLQVAPVDNHNILALILDVHLRVLFVSLCLILVARFFSWCLQWIDTLAYVSKVKAGDSSKFVAERQSRHWLNPIRIVEYVRDAIYHPWALMTAYNRHREILMVDVMCKGDNLYSGLFTSWTPHGEDACSSVAMQYILRYYPKGRSMVTEGGVTSSEGIASTTEDGHRAKKVRRRLGFIENNGEMIFPFNKVETIHFWELRRGTRLILTIRGMADFELTKWWLVINEVNPGKIKTLVIEFQDQGEKFRDRLLDWTRERRFLLKNVEQLEPRTLNSEVASPSPTSPVPEPH